MGTGPIVDEFLQPPKDLQLTWNQLE
jgi:hypothetical protein